MARPALAHLLALVHGRGRLGLDSRGRLDPLNALGSPFQVGLSPLGLRLQWLQMIFERMDVSSCP